MNPWIVALIVAVGVSLLSKKALGSGGARRVMGYRSGQPIPIEIVFVDGVWLEARTADAYGRMRNAALEEAQIRLKANSGFRSMEQQTEFYNMPEEERVKRGIGKLVARPGYSNHQSGIAVDISQVDPHVFPWMETNARRFGFVNTVKSEPWHWEKIL